MSIRLDGSRFYSILSWFIGRPAFYRWAPGFTEKVTSKSNQLVSRKMNSKRALVIITTLPLIFRENKRSYINKYEYTTNTSAS